MQQDANERAKKFQTMVSTTGELLIDLIDNRPIDVLGDYVAFPSRKFHEENNELDSLKEHAVEKLMTLPTRGVFGEAKLGHCNASEIIDNTRFWDWQKSPITEEAPGIDDLNINASRNATPNLTPTAFPASILNIVTPQNLPDPTGMSGALTLLGKSDIFRDMSVSSQVEDLLKKISDNTIGIAEAANKAKEIENQRQQQSSSPSPAKSTGANSEQDSKLSPQQFMDWANAIKNAPVSQEQKKDINQDLTAGAKKSVNPAPAKPTIKHTHLKFQINLVDGDGRRLVGRFGVDVTQRSQAVGFLQAVERSDDGKLVVEVLNDYNDPRYDVIVNGEILAGRNINAELKGGSTVTIPQADFEQYDYFYLNAIPKTDTFDIEASNSTEVTEEIKKHFGGGVDVELKKVITIKTEAGEEWNDGKKHTSQKALKMKVMYYLGGFDIVYNKAN